jgi:hypothetical protein
VSPYKKELLRKKLKEAVSQLVAVEVEHSWRGEANPDEWPAIEKKRKNKWRAYNRTLAEVFGHILEDGLTVNKGKDNEN